MNDRDPYRPSPDKGPTSNPGVHLLDDAELAFWERALLAVEASPVGLKDGWGPESVASRADALTLARRDRLPLPEEGET